MVSTRRRASCAVTGRAHVPGVSPDGGVAGARADRVALTLVNQWQSSSRDLEVREPGAVLLTAAVRNTVLQACHERKRMQLRHARLIERLALGLVPQVLAQLLARHLRKDVNDNPAWIWSQSCMHSSQTPSLSSRKAVKGDGGGLHESAKTVLNACSFPFLNARSIRHAGQPCTRPVDAIDPDRDSLRFSLLGREWRRRVERFGANPSEDPDGLPIARCEPQATAQGGVTACPVTGQAATCTTAAVLCGAGTGSPCSRRLLTCSTMAAPFSRITSSRVAPVATHPGKSGT